MYNIGIVSKGETTYVNDGNGKPRTYDSLYSAVQAAHELGFAGKEADLRFEVIPEEGRRLNRVHE
jgi:hypothetical protein